MPKLTFVQKWKIKKQIKALEKCIKLERKIIEKLNSKMGELNKEELGILKEQKELMIEAIMGNKDKNTIGMKDIFEISDKDSGEEITENDLRKESIEDLTNLLEDLVNSLKGEI